MAIQAAGVVLVKGRGKSQKVLLVHRPRHKDWSLPKGKLDPGEGMVEAAIRECDEETGVTPILALPLGQQHYRFMGRPKTVDYWKAHVGSAGRFTADDEVDRIKWVDIADVSNQLTYRRDREFVAQALAAPRTWPLILLRHAAAEKRNQFSGRDYRRPLVGKGRTQARALAPLLAAYGITDVRSSTSTRCMETVRPFTRSAGLKVQSVPQLSEEATARKPKATRAYIQEALLVKHPLVLCSHRPVLPLLLTPILESADRKQANLLDEPLKPGGMIVVHRSFSKGKWRIEAVERHLR